MFTKSKFSKFHIPSFCLGALIALLFHDILSIFRFFLAESLILCINLSKYIFVIICLRFLWHFYHSELALDKTIPHATSIPPKTQTAVPPTNSANNSTLERNVPTTRKAKSRPKPPLMDWIDKLPDEQNNLHAKTADKVTDEYAEVIFPTGNSTSSLNPFQPQQNRLNNKNKEKGAYTIFVEKTNHR